MIEFRKKKKALNVPRDYELINLPQKAPYALITQLDFYQMRLGIGLTRLENSPR